jgi:hypothetical protein
MRPSRTLPVLVLVVLVVLLLVVVLWSVLVVELVLGTRRSPTPPAPARTSSGAPRLLTCTSRSLGAARTATY